MIVAIEPGHIFRYAFGNGLKRFIVARCAQVSQIRLGKRLIAAFEFIREWNVLDAAFLVISQRCVCNGLERLRAPGAEVEDAGNAIFPEPQVHRRDVADVDEVALEAVAAFEQFRTFAIIQLGVQMESDAGTMLPLWPSRGP